MVESLIGLQPESRYIRINRKLIRTFTNTKGREECAVELHVAPARNIPGQDVGNT